MILWYKFSYIKTLPLVIFIKLNAFYVKILVYLKIIGAQYHTLLLYHLSRLADYIIVCWHSKDAIYNSVEATLATWYFQNEIFIEYFVKSVIACC